MTVHTPVPDYAAARESMVDTQLRPTGVSAPPVVEAMREVPREEFVAPEARPLAYTDRSVPIGGGRLMSGPVVLGRLLSEALPRPGERALVVGCGTGYSATVLKHLGVEVLGLESDPMLAARAREQGVDVVEGPLEQGWKKGGPFDLILIDGAIEYIPDGLIAQLTPHGRLVTALLDRGIPRLVIGRRAGEGFGLRSIADMGAAALPGFARPQGFTF